MQKFYTAFLFSPTNARLHCTHKYLGELTNLDFADVLEVIKYYNPSSIPAPRPVFSRVTSVAGLKRALVTGGFASDAEAFGPWENLRNRLSRVRPDDFYFMPHISTPDLQPDFSEPFTHYALCTGYEVIEAWPIK